MSVNHFPYLPLVTNLQNDQCIETVIQIATKIQVILPVIDDTVTWHHYMIWKII